MQKTEVDKYAIKVGGGSYFVLDLFTSFSIQESSSVSELPLVNRTKIIDHKYDDPRKITVGGSVSNFNNSQTYPHYERESDSIVFRQSNKLDTYVKRVYEFLRDIKLESVVVSIITPNLIIKNCILSDISWSENNNTADYSLTFQEIKFYEIREAQVKVTKDENGLPNLDDSVPQNFVETILEKIPLETDMLILKTLRDSNLCDNKFLKSLAVTGTVLAAGALVLAVSIGIIVAGAASTVPVVGWIIAGVILVGIAIASAIAWFVNLFKRAWRRKVYIDAFTAYTNKEKNEQEQKRYKKMRDKIYENIRQLNTRIQCLTFQSNVSQELLFTLNNRNYILKLVKEDSNGKSWKYTITNEVDEPITFENTKYENRTLNPYISFYKCTYDNFHFQDGTYKCYFIVENDQDTTKQLTDSKKTYLETIDLTKIKLVYSDLDMDEFKKLIGNIVLESMKRK